MKPYIFVIFHGGGGGVRPPVPLWIRQYSGYMFISPNGAITRLDNYKITLSKLSSSLHQPSTVFISFILNLTVTYI